MPPLAPAQGERGKDQRERITLRLGSGSESGGEVAGQVHEAGEGGEALVEAARRGLHT